MLTCESGVSNVMGSEVCAISHSFWLLYIQQVLEKERWQILVVIVYVHTLINDKIILFLATATMCALPTYLFVHSYIKFVSKNTTKIKYLLPQLNHNDASSSSSSTPNTETLLLTLCSCWVT